jgi:hypothetical protein
MDNTTNMLKELSQMLDTSRDALSEMQKKIQEATKGE